MRKNNFKGLVHIGIFTDNYEGIMDFYTKKFPFSIIKETVEEHPGDKSGYYPMKWALIGLGDLYLEIMECANHALVEYDNAGVFNHLGISVDNLDEAIAFLKERGVEPDRFEQIIINSELFPGQTYRSVRLRGYHGELIGLYEMDNKSFFAIH